MKISDSDIIKFQELYKRHFSCEISKEEAIEKGSRLVRMVEIVLKNNNKRYCSVCGDLLDLKDFKDSLSEKEFTISGLCQKCQDKTFK